MKTFLTICVLSICSFCSAQTYKLIKNITIVDSNGITENQYIVIQGNKVIDIATTPPSSYKFDQTIEGENKYYILKFYCNDKSVKNGYVHFLSNDLTVNDIELCEEKRISDKLSKKGIYRVERKFINKKFNRQNKDTIRGFLRCENGVGYSFKFYRHIVDTIKIYIRVSEYKYSCLIN